jgi:lysyl-tRNA synthetase class II
MDKSRMGESFQSLKDWTDAGDIIGNHLFSSSSLFKFFCVYMLSVRGTCIGVRGTIKRTEKGELSIYAKVTFF